MNEDDPLPLPSAEDTDAQPRLVASIAGSLGVLVALGLVAGHLAAGRPAVGAGASLRGQEELFQNGVEAMTDIDRSWAKIDRSPGAAPGGYAWVDRKAGIVQVPIERAIDLVCSEQVDQTGRKEPVPSPR